VKRKEKNNPAGEARKGPGQGKQKGSLYIKGEWEVAIQARWEKQKKFGESCEQRTDLERTRLPSKRPKGGRQCKAQLKGSKEEAL